MLKEASIRKVYYGLLTFVVIAFGLSMCVGGCMESLCGNDIVQEIPSPDKKLKVVVFSRNCGATTGFSTHVSLLPRHQKLSNFPGNLLSARWQENTAGIISLAAPLKVSWNGKNNISIYYPAGLKVSYKRARLDGINIVYNREADDRP